MYKLKIMNDSYTLIKFLNDENVKPNNIIKLDKNENCWTLIYYINDEKKQ